MDQQLGFDPLNGNRMPLQFETISYTTEGSPPKPVLPTPSVTPLMDYLPHINHQYQISSSSDNVERYQLEHLNMPHNDIALPRPQSILNLSDPSSRRLSDVPSHYSMLEFFFQS